MGVLRSARNQVIQSPSKRHLTLPCSKVPRLLTSQKSRLQQFNLYHGRSNAIFKAWFETAGHSDHKTLEEIRRMAVERV